MDWEDERASALLTLGLLAACWVWARDHAWALPLVLLWLVLLAFGVDRARGDWALRRSLAPVDPTAAIECQPWARVTLSTILTTPKEMAMVTRAGLLAVLIVRFEM